MGPGERIKELKVLFRYLRAQTAKKEKKIEIIKIRNEFILPGKWTHKQLHTKFSPGQRN